MVGIQKQLQLLHLDFFHRLFLSCVQYFFITQILFCESRDNIVCLKTDRVYIA